MRCHSSVRTALAIAILGAAALAAAAPVDPGGLIAQQRATLKGLAATRPAGPNPMLSFLPVGAKPDHEAWRRWLSSQGKAKRAALPLVDATHLVVMGESEPNNTQVTGDPVVGFGTGIGQDSAADISGTISAGSSSLVGPFPEDDGAIPLASVTGLVSGASIKTSGTIGDGPYGSAGTGSGDYDFYAMGALAAGDTIVVDVDTPLPFSGDLDPFVAVWDSGGNLLAYNDDDGATFDSYLTYSVPAAGTYYVSIGAYSSPFPTDPFDSSSGVGFASEGTYDVTLGVNSLDSDFFTIALQAGDVISANALAATGARVALFDPSGGLRIESGQDATSIEPGPFPGGGAAALAYVVEAAGPHAIRVRGPVGPYTLEVRVFRAPLNGAPPGAVQTLFVDFNGATVDPAIFGGPSGSAALSPLSSFLAGWGLVPGDENAVIDAILDTIEENLSTDMRVLGLNGDFDLSGAPGDFDIVILNSRDHADPFGGPNVSRLIIGGTISELGISTIGIAQSIDPGNFATDETAVVLLDLLSAPSSDPNSLNQFSLAGSATKIDLVGAGVGNIASHEAGHFFANFHTDQFNPTANIMDQGGNLPGIVGVGTDLTLGTGDDDDVDFGPDSYVPNEGFLGTEDTLNAVAFGLPTSPGCSPTPLASCRTAQKTTLQLKDKTPDTGDQVIFKWTKGASTAQPELGDPLTSANYKLCVYDANGLVRKAVAPAGGVCSGKPCWKLLGSVATPKGFKYANRDLSSNGTSSVTLKSGASPVPKAIWKAKGLLLDDSALSLVPPVVAQVSNSDTSVCFEDVYGVADIVVNDTLQFKAKGVNP
jgi:hypothetical protein